jgi:hypothetical protein
MAYSIAEHLLRAPRAQVVHLNGSFHTEKRLGITEHLLRYRPGTSVLAISIVSNKSFPNFDVAEMADLGDIVIVTDPQVKRTIRPHADKKYGPSPLSIGGFATQFDSRSKTVVEASFCAFCLCAATHYSP